MTMQNALLTIPICNCYKKKNQGVHCAHPENTHTPPTGGIGISCKTQNFKEMCEALLEFPEWWGGGGVLKSLPWGRYGYFLELPINVFSRIASGFQWQA